MNNEEIRIIVEAVNQFEKCKFKDINGHRLERNIYFEKIILSARHYFKPSGDDRDFCDICGGNFRDIRFHQYTLSHEKKLKSVPNCNMRFPGKIKDCI